MPKNPPEGMPRITPYLSYNDVSAAVSWLAEKFGLEVTMTMPGPDGTTMHAEMRLADGVVMLGLANPEQGTKSPKDLPAVNQSLYIYVDNFQEHYERAINTGAQIVMEPEEMFWGDRIYGARDLEGHYWTFAEHVKDIAPEDMKLPPC